MPFVWWDLIAPWGICLGAAALCLWAVIAAENWKGKLVSAITGVFFLGAIGAFYWVRSDKTEYTYKTEYGIGVVAGEKNTCEQADVEADIQWVIDFWSKHYDADKVKDSLKHKRLFCIDEEEFSVYGRWVRGVTTGNSAVVGWNGKAAYTSSLIRHELSHLILAGAGVAWNEKLHHDTFKAKGLGH